MYNWINGLNWTLQVVNLPFEKVVCPEVKWDGQEEEIKAAQGGRNRKKN